jgi:predicted peroxiredoxin
MTEYVLVESRHPFTDPGDGAFVRDAVALAAAGHRVRLCLVQEGVLGAAARTGGIVEALRAGVRIQADAHSLARHALRAADLPADIEVQDMAAFARTVLAADTRVVWH